MLGLDNYHGRVNILINLIEHALTLGAPCIIGWYHFEFDFWDESWLV